MARLGTLGHLERRRLELRSPAFPAAPAQATGALHLAAGLITARGLGWRTNGRRPASCAPCRPASGSTTDQPQPTLLPDRQRQPADLIGKLWEPICVAALNTPFARPRRRSSATSCATVWPERVTPAIMLFNRGDLGSAFSRCRRRPHPKTRRRRFRLGARSRPSPGTPGGFRLRRRRCPASHVIIATHPARAGRSADRSAGHRRHAQTTRRLTWQPILTLWLRFAEP
jgi:hydroxysqualene dehydroxylase